MNPDDYDEDGNNIVPCPICLSKYCSSKQGEKCPEEENYKKWLDTNVYEDFVDNDINKPTP